jgi:hypothetical protein
MPDDFLTSNPFPRTFRKDFEQTIRCYFGGGGGRKTPPNMPAYTPPAQPKVEAPPPLPPPSTYETVDARAQEEEVTKRKGMRKTQIAGETGGYQNPVTGTSLLGG